MTYMRYIERKHHQPVWKMIISLLYYTGLETDRENGYKSPRERARDPNPAHIHIILYGYCIQCIPIKYVEVR